MQDHKEPFSETGIGPVIIGIIIVVVIWLAGIGAIGYLIYKLIF